ncbi:GNAT family N-acetyltransferase [Aeromonas jandaei]|uniref:GNAT family N-acetyltransferase n=1 Tax=Aeromonas jandaei TaxID=650 RepID=A0ABD7EMW1_AERJA|nr:MULTISPECIES: GNAT family N-acetyltransferase [Aeromonas]MCF7719582.1 GNAT family N-acetyltransferase [Aeromonas jandaei]QWL62001.1 GNAT family N-acetyltransferase [Aeromonas jandaei]
MIRIEKIDASNCFEVCELTTNKDGVGTLFEQYLCCNAISLVEAAYFPGFEPRAIYRGEELVGFVMYKGGDAPGDMVEIFRFMLDARFMGQGLGRQVFGELLAHFGREGYREVLLMIDEDNRIAKELYASFGFRFTGKIEKDEHYYSLNIEGLH